MKRIALLLALVAGLLAASPAQSQTTGFAFVCEHDSTQPIDPIVYPGVGEAPAHMHEFFGGQVNENSSREQLLSEPTGCHYGDDNGTVKDHSGYWVPSLYQDDVRVEPYNANAYFLKPNGEGAEGVRSTPQGLKIIAGATHDNPGSPYVNWGCTDMASTYPAPVDCFGGRKVKTSTIFPSCMKRLAWLDSSDHRNHMRYAVSGRGCPGAYPKPVPTLKLTIRYKISSVGGLSLSSGPVSTMHADFMEAVGQSLMQERMRTCLNADRRCGLDGTIR